MDSARGTLLTLLLDGVRLQERAIAEIASRGAIPILVVEPSETWREALQAQGWNGEPVWAMSARTRRALSCSDAVTERWLATARPEVSRIFAVVDDESLLVNRERGLLSIEPSSS